jgi:hypothetical protein
MYKTSNIDNYHFDYDFYFDDIYFDDFMDREYIFNILSRDLDYYNTLEILEGKLSFIEIHLDSINYRLRNGGDLKDILHRINFINSLILDSKRHIKDLKSYIY